MDTEAASVQSAPSDLGVVHPGTLQFITGAIHHGGTLPIKLPPVSGSLEERFTLSLRTCFANQSAVCALGDGWRGRCRGGGGSRHVPTRSDLRVPGKENLGMCSVGGANAKSSIIFRRKQMINDDSEEIRVERRSAATTRGRGGAGGHALAEDPLQTIPRIYSRRRLPQQRRHLESE